MKLALDQFIFALSDTVDLVGVDELYHGKRVGYMAWKCAEIQQLSSNRQQDLLFLGLLHDSGVSSTKERKQIMNELDWKNMQMHCSIGSDRMEYFEPLSRYAKPILYHHTRWDKLDDAELSEEEKQAANLIFLLDRVDYLAQVTPGPNYLSKKNVIRNKVQGYKGKYFAPQLVEVFMEVSDNEAFWFALDSHMIADFIEQRKKTNNIIKIQPSQMKVIAELFATIIDAKSQYTADHSFGVAQLASYLAKKLGFDSEKCLMIEVGGLLHDIGKLQVPDSLLEKQGPLGEREFSSMQHHSFNGYRILRKIDGMEKIALWTANHHEALDGSGYPFRRKADQLCLESRLITTADIFQALAQERPYRKAQPLEKITSYLEKNARKGRLDETIVDLIIKNKKECYSHALEFEV